MSNQKYEPLKFPADDVMKQLTDEQRKVITDWHNNSVRHEEEKRKEETKIARTGIYCSVIPFAVWLPTKNFFDGKFGPWMLVAEIIAGLIVFGTIAMVSQRIIDHACRDGFSETRIIGYSIVYGCVVFALACSVFN